MSSISSAGNAYVDVKINDIDIWGREIRYAEMVYLIGNRLPQLRMTIVTDRQLVYENSMVELGIIEIEMGMLDDSESILDSKKGRYLIVAREQQGQYENVRGRYRIDLTAFADCRKYIEKCQLRGGKEDKRSVEFLKDVKGIGDGSKGSGTLDCQIKDDLLNRTGDKQKWIEPDQTGIETVNQVLLRSFIEDKPKGDKEWVVTACVDFKDDNSGDPCLTFYDLKLRTLTFDPPSVNAYTESTPLQFTFKGTDGWIGYDSCKPDFQNAADSIRYNGREAPVFDIEQNVYDNKVIDQPLLFEDSQQYKEQSPFNGSSPQGEFQMLTSNARYLTQFQTTNHYSTDYTNQAIQSRATHSALSKVKMQLTFPRLFVKAKPIDICKIEVQTSQDDELLIVNPSLSTKYMVLTVAHVYVNGVVSTYIIAGRDTFSSNG
jgi:hypothetical protein